MILYLYDHGLKQLKRILKTYFHHQIQWVDIWSNLTSLSYLPDQTRPESTEWLQFCSQLYRAGWPANENIWISQISKQSLITVSGASNNYFTLYFTLYLTLPSSTLYTLVPLFKLKLCLFQLISSILFIITLHENRKLPSK